MFEIRASFDGKALKKELSAFALKQMPFAAAEALNGVARMVVKAEGENEEDVLDRPREFTKGAIRVARANKRRLRAVVYMMDTTARYLEPYEFGGSNVLNGKALLKPIGAVSDLDRYGNLPRNYIKKMAARKDVFVGSVKTKAGPVSGVWQRTSEEGAAVKVQRRRRDGTAYLGKTRRGGNTSGRLKLLVKFDDAHPVNQKLGWFEVAEIAVRRSFNPQMTRALTRALATAKK